MRHEAVAHDENMDGSFLSQDLSLEEPNSALPDVIVTRRSRSDSVCGRILEEEESGRVKYFCRSRGHGFVVPEGQDEEIFMHISDIEGEFVPREGDTVSYRLCPIPPRFDRFQAVHVHIVRFSPDDDGEKRPRRRWETPETPEEIEADRYEWSLEIILTKVAPIVL